MEGFVLQLHARLEADGYRSHSQKAGALGVDPATWSRARRSLVRFSPQVVRAGLARYPDLARYLADPKPNSELELPVRAA
jgi:hypothetical protein